MVSFDVAKFPFLYLLLMRNAQIDLSVSQRQGGHDTAQCHVPLKRSALESTHDTARKAHPIVDILVPRTLGLTFTHTEEN
jgi:hypothetical protein